MKTIILTSAGMNVKEEILKALPKSADQIKLAHIITATKVKDNVDYMERDRKKMAEAGFSVQDIDIEGKNEEELKKLLAGKDVIYVQGGGYILSVKACHGQWV